MLGTPKHRNRESDRIELPTKTINAPEEEIDFLQQTPPHSTPKPEPQTPPMRPIKQQC